MNLKALEGKTVKVTTSYGSFTGDVTDYFYPDDDESEMIALENCPQRPNQWVGILAEDILGIEVIG